MRDVKISKQPNIVLICVDQWRGDCLGIVGHSVVKTPYLDQLAAKGTKFTRAYSATPTCIPARAALYTGLSQKTHGRVGYQDGIEWNYKTTIASEFTRNGYQSCAIGKMHVYPERSQTGFQQVILHDGFLHHARKQNENLDYIDDYIPWLRNQLGYNADYFDHGVNCNSIVARPWDKPEYTHPTNWVVNQGINFLRKRDKRKPFFLFLSFHRPHPPYDPPAWAFEQYLNQSMPEVPVGDWVNIFDEYAQPWSSECQVGEIDPIMRHRARAGYYGHMTHIDQQINRFLESLAEFGLDGNTYICFLSDHGELMGDHHLFRKSMPYEGSVRVPMILAGPKDSDIKPANECSELVELRDVMPTLLDCANIPKPNCVEGYSLLPLACGQRQQLRPYLHGEHTVIDQSLQWIRDERFKYIWHSKTGREQLFDIKNDPRELCDIAGQASFEKHLENCRNFLITELSGREEGYTDGKKLIKGKKPINTLTSISKFK